MISLRRKHLKRYKDNASLLFKYGRSELAKQAGLADVFDSGDEVMSDSDSAKTDELAEDFERRSCFRSC